MQDRPDDCLFNRARSIALVLSNLPQLDFILVASQDTLLLPQVFYYLRRPCRVPIIAINPRLPIRNVLEAPVGRIVDGLMRRRAGRGVPVCFLDKPGNLCLFERMGFFKTFVGNHFGLRSQISLAQIEDLRGVKPEYAVSMAQKIEKFLKNSSRGR